MDIDEELEKYGVWIKKGPMDSPQEDSEPLDLAYRQSAKERSG